MGLMYMNRFLLTVFLFAHSIFYVSATSIDLGDSPHDYDAPEGGIWKQSLNMAELKNTEQEDDIDLFHGKLTKLNTQICDLLKEGNKRLQLHGSEPNVIVAGLQIMSDVGDHGACSVELKVEDVNVYVAIKVYKDSIIQTHVHSVVLHEQAAGRRPFGFISTGRHESRDILGHDLDYYSENAILHSKTYREALDFAQKRYLMNEEALKKEFNEIFNCVSMTFDKDFCALKKMYYEQINAHNSRIAKFKIFEDSALQLRKNYCISGYRTYFDTFEQFKKEIDDKIPMWGNKLNIQDDKVQESYYHSEPCFIYHLLEKRDELSHNIDDLLDPLFIDPRKTVILRHVVLNINSTKDTCKTCSLLYSCGTQTIIKDVVFDLIRKKIAQQKNKNVYLSDDCTLNFFVSSSVAHQDRRQYGYLRVDDNAMIDATRIDLNRKEIRKYTRKPINAVALKNFEKNNYFFQSPIQISYEFNFQLADIEAKKVCSRRLETVLAGIKDDDSKYDDIWNLDFPEDAIVISSSDFLTSSSSEIL